MAKPVLGRLLLAAALSALFALSAPPCSAARRRPAKSLAGRTIGSIRIETFNVFNTSVYPESKLPYRMANALHRTTREKVVRRELLFEEGQPYDANLIAETERNLRLLPFIRRASAEAVVNSSGTVDVVVRTDDAWSLELVANFKRAGGVTELKGGFTERNLMGRGAEVSVEYRRSGTSPSKTVSWKETQFLGRPHLNLTMAANSGPDTRDVALALERPFYASIARASKGLTGSYSEKKIALYDGESQIGEALRRSGEAAINVGVALATSTWRTRRLRGGIVERRVEFLPVPGSTGPLPARERFLILQAGLDWEELDFVSERRIQKFTHDEDYNLGVGVFPSVAWAPPLPGVENSQSQVMPGLTLSKGFERDDRLLLLRASYTTSFVNGANANRIAGGDALYFIMGLPRQTVALHASYDHGWRLDRASRLTLGESNGLRGYGLGQFDGQRRLLLNVEDRFFLYDEWLRLLDIGAVLFYDSGYVWREPERTSVSDLRHSVGFGLRLAPSRSAGNRPLRIDVARALNPNGADSRWTLSILAGHAFGPD